MGYKRLDDSQWLFTVLTALVKKNGGELKITEETILEVSKKDVVGLFWDKRDSSIILKLVSDEELKTTSLQEVDTELDN
jgi:hypothetical protein